MELFVVADNVEWLTIASNIDHEFWLVKDLKPNTNHVFRLSAKNSIGWSEKGIPTALIKTLEPGEYNFHFRGAYGKNVSSKQG